MVQGITEKNPLAISNRIYSNANSFVESVKSYIKENDCPTLSMDISHMNIIDASKVTLLCSTYHWAKYPQGEVNCVINSPEIKNIINSLNLGNVKLTKGS